MRKTASLFAFLFVISGLSLGLAKPAIAEDDPPGRVARLNYIQGSVSYQVSGDTDWVQADPNRPLTTGDNLWADRNSRGELHIGSTAIRMSEETGVSFLTLDDRTIQLQLAQGLVEVHLRNQPAGDAFEIDTQNLALTLTRAGEYRIETDPDGRSTIITVYEGEGEVTGGGDSYGLRPGLQYTFTGTDQLTYESASIPPDDDFEDWCQSRDDRENHAVSARYVSRDVDGYYDLDDYGAWEDDPDYGAMWVPRSVMVGWVPYHYGHWVWIAPWGWTWVDEEPWGFAPFHYGRWCYVRNHWGWVPGPIVVRPVYAPALVAFVGGGGFTFSISFGSEFAGVAWFPLGPRDVFVPAYRCSPRYVQVVNVTNTRVVNVTQVTNVYNTVVINRDVTRVNYTYARNTAAVTAVSRETFVGARSVSAASVRVTNEQMERARVIETAPVAPTRSSYVFAAAKRASAKPMIAFNQRPVIAKMNPEATVNRRAVEYTNDTAPFNRGQGGKPAAPQGAAAPPPSRDGFKPFQPPKGAAPQTGGAPPSQPQTPQADRTKPFPDRATPPAQPPAQPQAQSQAQPQGQPQNEARRTMRFTPPVKARDDMYDVHPPLRGGARQDQGQRPEQQRQEPQRREQTAPKPPSPEHRERDDSQQHH